MRKKSIVRRARIRNAARRQRLPRPVLPGADGARFERLRRSHSSLGAWLQGRRPTPVEFDSVSELHTHVVRARGLWSLVKLKEQLGADFIRSARALGRPMVSCGATHLFGRGAGSACPICGAR